MDHFKSYDIIFFDCDGVILDSNKLKSDAFYNITVDKYGKENAQKLVKLNHELGGVNRQKKFKIFFEQIVIKKNYVSELNQLCEEFSKFVRKSYSECSFTEGFLEFIETLPSNIKKFVISGGNEAELREVLNEKNISHLFDGIYGSPRDKIEIVESLNVSKDSNVLFIGDGLRDWQTAQFYNFDFLFVKKYSEFKNYREIIPTEKLNEINDFREIL